MKIEFVTGAEDIKAHKKFIDTQDDDYMYRHLINLLYCKTSSLTKCINHLI